MAKKEKPSGLEGASEHQRAQWIGAQQDRDADVSTDGSELTADNEVANQAWRAAFERGFK